MSEQTNPLEDAPVNEDADLGGDANHEPPGAENAESGADPVDPEVVEETPAEEIGAQAAETEPERKARIQRNMSTNQHNRTAKRDALRKEGVPTLNVSVDDNRTPDLDSTPDPSDEVVPEVSDEDA